MTLHPPPAAGTEARARISLASNAASERWAVELSCTHEQLEEALTLGPDTVEQVRQRLHYIKLRDKRRRVLHRP